MNEEEMKIPNGVNGSSAVHWNPRIFIENESERIGKETKYAVLVLNRPILVPTFAQLWNGASLRCCVDGGMNRFMDFISNSQETPLEPPELLTGDFDSCHPSSMEYAKSVNCQIIKTPDQNETDFTKALRSINFLLQEREISSVLVVVETSGRLDQIMANVNTLFKSEKIFGDAATGRKVFILSSNSLSWLLQPGSHVIQIPRELVECHKYCAIVPFTRTHATTKGLKWDLEDGFLEFGGMVSTSNTYKNDVDVVEVSTDNAVLWIMGTNTTLND